jgi:uncharacterized OsmC-like protein
MSVDATKQHNNGIDVEALNSFVDQVRREPSAGVVSFGVVTKWEGGTRTRALTMPIRLGSTVLERDFVIGADEPPELLGTNQAANPQELLLAAFNACVAATYVANAAARGIALKSLTVRAQGILDLRGYLGLDASINPGYDQIECQVEIESPAERSELEALHSRVKETSPNFQNFARAIEVKTSLLVRS